MTDLQTTYIMLHVFNRFISVTISLGIRQHPSYHKPEWTTLPWYISQPADLSLPDWLTVDFFILPLGRPGEQNGSYLLFAKVHLWEGPFFLLGSSAFEFPGLWYKSPHITWMDEPSFPFSNLNLLKWTFPPHLLHCLFPVHESCLKLRDDKTNTKE